jgi:DNA-binding transcriptional LysR family regulator
MHGMQLSGVDANLVAPLHALLEERSVAAAARRIGLSPSATSHALARLRVLFDDPLLARAGRKLVRTPRGEALFEASRRAVEALGALLRPERPFDARTMKRSFRIATTDHVQLALLRGADRLLTSEAPGVDLYCLPMDRGSMAALREGHVDFSIGVFDEPPPDVRKAALFVDRLVTVVRTGHRLLRGKPSLERFVEHQHVLVAPLGSPSGLVDDILARRGMARRVARTVPTFVEAALLVAETDYVVTIPRTVVEAFRKQFRLSVFKVPLALPQFTIAMVWHRRNDTHPEHAWMRDLIVRSMRPPSQRHRVR